MKVSGVAKAHVQDAGLGDDVQGAHTLTSGLSRNDPGFDELVRLGREIRNEPNTSAQSHEGIPGAGP